MSRIIQQTNFNDIFSNVDEQNEFYFYQAFDAYFKEAIGNIDLISLTKEILLISKNSLINVESLHCLLQNYYDIKTSIKIVQWLKVPFFILRKKIEKLRSYEEYRSFNIKSIIIDTMNLFSFHITNDLQEDPLYNKKTLKLKFVDTLYVIFFFIVYSDIDSTTKSYALYEILCYDSNYVSFSDKTFAILMKKYLTFIIVFADCIGNTFLKGNKYSDEDFLANSLFKMFNSNIVFFKKLILYLFEGQEIFTDFIIYICQYVIFKQNTEVPILSRSKFLEEMKSSGFCLFKPNAIRKEFINFLAQSNLKTICYLKEIKKIIEYYEKNHRNNCANIQSIYKESDKYDEKETDVKTYDLVDDMINIENLISSRENFTFLERYNLYNLYKKNQILTLDEDIISGNFRINKQLNSARTYTELSNFSSINHIPGKSLAKAILGVKIRQNNLQHQDFKEHINERSQEFTVSKRYTIESLKNTDEKNIPRVSKKSVKDNKIESWNQLNRDNKHKETNQYNHEYIIPSDNRNFKLTNNNIQTPDEKKIKTNLQSNMPSMDIDELQKYISMKIVSNTQEKLKPQISLPKERDENSLEKSISYIHSRRKPNIDIQDISKIEPIREPTSSPLSTSEVVDINRKKSFMNDYSESIDKFFNSKEGINLSTNAKEVLFEKKLNTFFRNYSVLELNSIKSVKENLKKMEGRKISTNIKYMNQEFKPMVEQLTVKSILEILNNKLTLDIIVLHLKLLDQYNEYLFNSELQQGKIFPKVKIVDFDFFILISQGQKNYNMVNSSYNFNNLFKKGYTVIAPIVEEDNKIILAKFDIKDQSKKIVFYDAIDIIFNDYSKSKLMIILSDSI